MTRWFCSLPMATDGTGGRRWGGARGLAAKRILTQRSDWHVMTMTATTDSWLTTLAFWPGVYSDWDREMGW